VWDLVFFIVLQASWFLWPEAGSEKSYLPRPAFNMAKPDPVEIAAKWLASSRQ
jgi:hypothetical protein